MTVGIILLLSAQGAGRDTYIKKYNTKVDTWTGTERAKINTSHWTVWNSDGGASTGIIALPAYTSKESQLADPDATPSIKTYDEAHFTAGVSQAFQPIPPYHAVTLTYKYSATQGGDTRVAGTQTVDLETHTQGDEQTLSACSYDGGTWDAGTRVCTHHKRLVAVCVKVRQGTDGSWTLDDATGASEGPGRGMDTQGCGAYFGWTPFLYEHFTPTTPSVSWPVTFSVFSNEDPRVQFYYIMGAAHGLNFGLTKKQKQEAGVACLVIGGLITFVVCCVASWGCRKLRGDKSSTAYAPVAAGTTVIVQQQPAVYAHPVPPPGTYATPPPGTVYAPPTAYPAYGAVQPAPTAPTYTGIPV
jgi:hypothetical protein